MIKRVINQLSATPTRKVTMGIAVGMPTAVVFTWIVNALILPLTGSEIQMPAEVSAAIGSIFSFIASYFVKETT